MEEINKGKCVIVFLKNGFRFKGPLISNDGNFICIHDDISKRRHFIALSEISNFEEVRDNE